MTQLAAARWHQAIPIWPPLVLVGLAVAVVAAGATGDAAEPPIVAVGFSPDGSQLVTASQRGLTVHDYPALSRRRQLSDPPEQVHDLTFSPAGTWLAVAGGRVAQAGEVVWYEWPSGRMAGKLACGADVLHQFSWSPVGTSWAAAGGGGEVFLGRDRLRTRPLSGHSRRVLAVAYSPRRRWLASAGVDRSIRVWSADGMRLIRIFSNHTAEVRDLEPRPGDQPGPEMLASAGADRTVRFWQPEIGRLVRFARLDSPPLDIAWTPDGRRILAACEDGRLHVVDPLQVTTLHRLPAVEGWAYCVACSPDGSEAIVGGAHGTLVRIRLPTDNADGPSNDGG